MFSTLKTLFAGQASSSEAAVKNHYALDLIDQKIREGDAGLNAAKTTLAALIQAHRTEATQTKAQSKRITNLTDRAKTALDKGLEELAMETAGAIADMQNELVQRQETVGRLDRKIATLRLRVEKSQRQLIDLRQGAISAKAIHAEQKATQRIASSLPGTPQKKRKN